MYTSCCNFHVLHVFVVVDMELMTSQLGEISTALNILRQLVQQNLDETGAIRQILDECPICQVGEGKRLHMCKKELKHYQCIQDQGSGFRGEGVNSCCDKIAVSELCILL